MLRAIKSKLNKTTSPNSSNIIRLVDTFDEEVTIPLLASDLLGEGVFSFETVINDSFTENYVVTPPFYREQLGEECYRDYDYLKNSINDIHCYTIELAKPSFLPIYTENEASLLQDLSLLHQKNSELYIQLLITQRQDNWQNEFIDQYSEYLNGNDYPSSKRVQRSVQRSILNVLNKFSGYHSQRKEVAEISSKILQNGFRFELKIITNTNNKDTFEDELNELLKEYDFFNNLIFLRDRHKKQFVDNFLNRRFSTVSKEQLISESELLSILSCDQVIPKQETIMDKIEKTKRLVTKVSNFDLLPIGEKKDRNIDEDIVAELPVALKKAKSIRNPNIEVLDVELGATVQRITFKIPEGHVYSDIKNKHEDINSALGSDINIIQGKEASTITFLIPCSQREIIYLKELLENEKFQEYSSANSLPFVCGVDMHNELVLKCLTKAPHLLVCGATNSGKSVFVNAVLITLILLKSPSELRIFLIDPKKVEFIQYNGFSHVEKVITDMQKAVVILDRLIAEMENRYEKFSKIGVRKIDAYNNKSKSKIPYILCGIDEYNDLRMMHPEVEEKIERLGQKARAAGIHLILATQRPDKEVMSGVIKTNFPSRVSFKLDNSNEYRTVFGTGIPYKNLLGFGDGVIKFVGQVEEFIRFQAPVISLDEDVEEKTFEKIKNLAKNEFVENIQLEDIKYESDLDKLKRLIANSGETRVSRLREEMGIKMNVVSQLMQQLVEEKWLEKPESKAKGYKLIASDEELAKWREH
ncbi:FtsK/SpoIIIE domain-containing protein [Metabacillus arenae]|uniref:DNA translocase FtsK n=1 Tax=Metabacillus arenae TaxID=2771434 RepID=A0A926NJD0_9BACI|nr:FtsK/SpoIIIE domain-containing protein [Metabacillus arenae]MBD1379182.1 DNA translocase FtsK [Metabacillus arenae]